MLPGGLCAVARHRGPYDGVSQVYEALTAFIKENGHEPSGMCYEVYLTDPEKVKPEKLKTDVVFVLKSQARNQQRSAYIRRGISRARLD